MSIQLRSSVAKEEFQEGLYLGEGASRGLRHVVGTTLKHFYSAGITPKTDYVSKEEGCYQLGSAREVYSKKPCASQYQ